VETHRAERVVSAVPAVALLAGAVAVGFALSRVVKVGAATAPTGKPAGGKPSAPAGVVTPWHPGFRQTVDLVQTEFWLARSE